MQPENSTSELLQSFVALKGRNPNAKIKFSVGGATANNNAFSQVAANETLRSSLAKNILAVCNQYGFDGVDLDWVRRKMNDDTQQLWFRQKL